MAETVEDQHNLVVTAIGDDDLSLLVIPVSWVISDLATYAVLLEARTFRDVREDEEAARLVAAWLPAYLNRHEGYGLEADEPTGADDEPFSAEDFFGEDDQMVWRPDARRTTADFLQQQEPVLADAYLRSDVGWGFDYEPCPYVRVEDRHHVEAELWHRGRVVRQWQGLPELYESPGGNPAAVLRAAVGEAL